MISHVIVLVCLGYLLGMVLQWFYQDNDDESKAIVRFVHVSIGTILLIALIYLFVKSWGHV